MPWRELPHTADLLLEITAPDWPGLAVEAALAFAVQLGEPDPDAPAMARPLAVAGIDREELLVHWLTEILVWRELEEVLPVAATVATATATELRGVIRVAPARRLTTVVKAVTYHDLAVAETAAGCRVRIVFDL
jgi:SHS2 domain-containing protein